MDDISCDATSESDNESCLSIEGNFTQDVATSVDKDKQGEKSRLRKELGEISLGELQKLQDKVGLKRYNQVLFGSGNSSEDDLSKLKSEKTTHVKKAALKQKKAEPEEISSKKRPKLNAKQVVSQNKRKRRDPRFDDRYGKFNDEMFQKSYAFVEEMKAEEKQKIKEELRKEKDPTRKTKLKQLVATMENKDRSQVKKGKEGKKFKEAEVLTQTGEKKKYFIKKSDQRKLELAEKFKKLKESGELENYMKKKRKKNTSKEKRTFKSADKISIT